MPMFYEDIVRHERKIKGFICQCCGDEFIDIMDIQEMVYFTGYGGYKCAFGDGADYEICLCTDCAYRLLKDYVHYADN